MSVLEYERIPYTIKVAPRAKRVTLRIQPGVGLVVSIPKRFARRDVPAVLAEHDQWIRSTLAEMEAKIPSAFRQWPPQLIDLKAIGETWQLHFENDPALAMDEVSAKPSAHVNLDLFDDPPIKTGAPARTDQRGVDEGTGQAFVNVHLPVDSADRLAVAKVCAERLKQRARRVLPSWVCHLALPHGISVKRISVRGQRTVWGSYSSSGTLSLNYKLLFLPPRYVDYVVLHELAHTRHLDHSPEFWAFLFSMDPEAKRLDASMNEVTQAVPPWLELA